MVAPVGATNVAFHLHFTWTPSNEARYGCSCQFDTQTATDTTDKMEGLHSMEDCQFLILEAHFKRQTECLFHQQ